MATTSHIAYMSAVADKCQEFGRLNPQAYVLLFRASQEMMRGHKGLTQEQYQTASSWGHGGPRGSHLRSFWTQRIFLCPNDSILCPYLTFDKSCPNDSKSRTNEREIARNFFGIRAIRGVLHGVVRGLILYFMCMT
eukprot:scaffold34529_cov55-Cyclotella_meneghiniana.AAC.5